MYLVMPLCRNAHKAKSFHNCKTYDILDVRGEQGQFFGLHPPTRLKPLQGEDLLWHRHSMDLL